jgi:hypothetical protein
MGDREVERRKPVFVGSVLPARPAKVTVTVELDNVVHADCGRPVSEHTPDADHWCTDPLEAAGWTPPGNCAGGCR